MAVRGDDPLVIQWNGGHTDFKTTQEDYIDRAKFERQRIGDPLPPLPAELFEPPPEKATADGFLEMADEFGTDLDRAKMDDPKPAESISYFATPTGIEDELSASLSAEIAAVLSDNAVRDPSKLSRTQDDSLDDSRRVAVPDGKPTIAELERAVVDALRAKLFDLASTLGRQLEDRRERDERERRERERVAGNVLNLDVRRRG